MEIQQKCLQRGVHYIEGKKEENKYVCRKRRKQIKCTQSGRDEIELRQQCLQYGVRYIDRDTNYEKR